jgi:hypothetical protein
MRMTAADQLELGVIDGIIPEPEGGAQADPDATARALRDALLAALARVTRMEPEVMLATRYARLRGIGVVNEAGIEPSRPLDEGSLRRRIGRLLRLPGVPRRPRWSEVWPGGDEGGGADDADIEGGA